MRHFNLAIVTIISVAVFVVLSFGFIQNGFWQDECYTLANFVFKPWHILFTDYHVPNNHIAFSAVLKLLAMITGQQSYCESFMQPALMRIVPIFFCMAAVYYLFRTAKINYGPVVAMLAVSVFCSTIVLLNFSWQLRGYMFSTLLSILVFKYFLQGLQANNRTAPVWLFIFNALNLFCLPTNVYLSASLIGLCILILLFPKCQSLFYTININRQAKIKTIIALATSTAIAIAYYVWLTHIQQLQEGIQKTSPFNWANLRQAPAILVHFVGNRYYLYLPMLFWVVMYVRSEKKSAALFFPAFCFVAPFIVFFLHGPLIIQRSFVPLIPFFAISVAIATVEIFNRLKWAKWLSALAFINLACFCISAYRGRQDAIRNNFSSVHKQDLKDHYYMYNFNAAEASSFAIALSHKTQAPLILADYYGGTGIKFYLQCNKTATLFADSLNSPFLQEAILLTNSKHKADSLLRANHFQFTRYLLPHSQYSVYYSKRD